MGLYGKLAALEEVKEGKVEVPVKPKEVLAWVGVRETKLMVIREGVIGARVVEEKVMGKVEGRKTKQC